jgi:hypothetical protein
LEGPVHEGVVVQRMCPRVLAASWALWSAPPDARVVSATALSRIGRVRFEAATYYWVSNGTLRLRTRSSTIWNQWSRVGGP